LRCLLNVGLKTAIEDFYIESEKKRSKVVRVFRNHEGSKKVR